MKKVDNLFKAKAANPVETAMLYDGRVGFLIPEYQREYDWSKKNIKRLYYDILNGFHSLSESAGAEAYTFLGTVILVEEDSKEEEFSGESVAVVDGQQRLTTLTLFACGLCELLRRCKKTTDFSACDELTARWLNKEIDELLSTLYDCVIGSQKVSSTTTFPFPRIIRSGDVRAKSKSQTHYKSPISKFLEGFADYFESDKVEYIPTHDSKEKDSKLASNYQEIRTNLSNLNSLDWYEDTECELFNVSAVPKSQCIYLLKKLPDVIKDENERRRTLSEIVENQSLEELLRTLMLTAYFCNCIVLARVITEDESAAFDIFDALNTTGEPLTAIETLKPRVVQFENRIRSYQGSESEQSFEIIAGNLHKRFTDTTKKQNETKELVITFALYLEGAKLSKDLSAQRKFLRRSYDSTKGSPKAARHFVASLANVAEFRKFYWCSDGIQELSRFHSNEHVEIVQLLVSLIKDMNTSLALPILLRYWNTDLKNSDGEERFVSILKALSAFIILRRAATGGTAGIDTDLRSIMSPKCGSGSGRKYALCAGAEHENTLLTPDQLKSAFRELLQHKLKSFDKDEWVNIVAANPLYTQSKDLVRFMILSAADGATASKSKCGTWQKSGVRASVNEKKFLIYKTWIADDYETVEHIAPDNAKSGEWNETLYNDSIMRHTLGNLILLPEKENSTIGNSSWEIKKKFYLACASPTKAQLQLRMQEAKTAGINFPKRTTDLLNDGKCLSLLEPLEFVPEWTDDIVKIRSQNIAELCWEVVRPWLE